VKVEPLRLAGATDDPFSLVLFKRRLSSTWRLADAVIRRLSDARGSRRYRPVVSIDKGELSTRVYLCPHVRLFFYRFRVPRASAYSDIYAPPLEKFPYTKKIINDIEILRP